MVEVLPIPRTVSASAEALLDLKREFLLPCAYHFYRRPPHIVRGCDFELFDSQGRSYIDCFSGVTVMNAGHCNPEITDAVIEQIRTLQHTTTIYLTEPILRLAEVLAETAPGQLTRSFFCASGSEATEGAMMLACRSTQRPGIVSMVGGLHGRTRWAVNATGIDMWRIDPFPLSDMWQVEFGNIDALADLLQRESHRIAAVILEPIQGNGGIVVPPTGYLRQVHTLCRAHDVLLILDEVQTGFNRTGRWFACEHDGVVPDVLCMSKALGNGFPIACFMTTDDIAADFTCPSASTYGGNPVSAVAALATIRFHTHHRLGAAAESAGAILRDGLTTLHESFPRMTEPPRGIGLMQGIPIIDTAGQPDATRTDDILEALKDDGILAGKTGPGRNVLTFMPPLTIPEESVRTVIGRLERCMQNASNG